MLMIIHVNKRGKRMKKNHFYHGQKGFTLVEVIVVLLIIGILLAISIPAILGYVSKAQDAKLEAEARSGYVAAQTITASFAAKGFSEISDDKKISENINGISITRELGESENGATIAAAGCIIDFEATLSRCAFVTNVDKQKAVIFTRNPSINEEPTTVVKISEGADSVTINNIKIPLK